MRSLGPGPGGRFSSTPPSVPVPVSGPAADFEVCCSQKPTQAARPTLPPHTPGQRRKRHRERLEFSFPAAGPGSDKETTLGLLRLDLG